MCYVVVFNFHIVLFFQCKPEYKVPGLYVIDSIVRQSRHQFGTDKDVFAPRFARNLQQTFIHLFSCPPEDKVESSVIFIEWFLFQTHLFTLKNYITATLECIYE